MVRGREAMRVDWAGAVDAILPNDASARHASGRGPAYALLPEEDGAREAQLARVAPGDSGAPCAAGCISPALAASNAVVTRASPAAGCESIFR